MASSDGPTSAADALGELLRGPLGRGLSPAAAAARAWYAANGDRERRHTTGVWLRKAPRAGLDPVMVVGVDSNLLAQELGTNKEIYLSRLAFRGVAVSDVKFVPRQRADEAIEAARRPKKGAPPLPTLSELERRRVDEAVRDLPEGLRQSVSRAMCASLRRHKGTNTHNQ